MITQSTNHTPQFIPLSPLDNLMPRVYTRIILCIHTEKTADPSAVTALLNKGLRKTVEQVPFLDGEVVRDTTNSDRLGRFAVTVSQLERLQLQSKDLTKKKQSDNSDCDWKWSFKELAQENWHFERFDGNILAPIRAFPDSFEESSPVMAAQANFIEGGLLLCAAFHHRVIDGTGVGTILRLWAQNCRQIENAENDVAKQNSAAPAPAPAPPSSSAIVITPEALDRTRLIPNAKIDVVELRTRQHPEYAVESPSTTPSPPPLWIGTVPEPTVEIFYFSRDAFARLKDAAKVDLPAKNAAKSKGEPVETNPAGFHEKQPVPIPWISTNDALSALLWTCITRARLRSATVGGDEGTLVTVDRGESKLGMANNGRRKLDPPLPDTYLGNVNLYSLAVLPSSMLKLETVLPTVARVIRTSINTINNEHICSAVRFIDALPDLAALRPSFLPFLGTDLAITSWAELGLNGLDWGHAVGTVERVRVPAHKVDGLCTVLPRTREGGLEVQIGLRMDAMRALATDELFTRFANVGGHSQDPLVNQLITALPGKAL